MYISNSRIRLSSAPTYNGYSIFKPAPHFKKVARGFNPRAQSGGPFQSASTTPTPTPISPAPLPFALTAPNRLPHSLITPCTPAPCAPLDIPRASHRTSRTRTMRSAGRRVGRRGVRAARKVSVGRGTERIWSGCGWVWVWVDESVGVGVGVGGKEGWRLGRAVSSERWTR